MQNKKKVIPQMITVGFKAMLDTLPDGVLFDEEKAYDALERFSNRTDNQDVSAFSDMLVEMQGSIVSEIPDEFDEEAIVDTMETHMREQLGTWQSNWQK
jgi:hypothetical protein